jgi:uncharacterized protein YcgL (UPF0745 family)
MNQYLKTIQDLLQQGNNLSGADKEALLKALTDADKQWSITDFKLDRTEKVKKTTAILLEETIEELEQKRKAVEAQNRELEIESSLERVRAVAMGMKKSDDLLSICEVLFKELQTLGFSNLRNALINTFADEQHYFIDYDFSDFAGGSSTRIPYSGHPAIEKYIKEATKKNDAFIELVVTGKELDDWKEFRRANGETDDPRLDNIAALYYYNYSIGVASIGISTFQPITQEKLEVLKRFRNVFDLAYKRYVDISKAEAQAREAKIEAALERTRTQSMIMQHSKELDDSLRVFHEQVLLLGIPSAFSFLWLPDEKNERHIFWAAWGEVKNSSTVFKSKAINYPLDRNEPATAQCLVDWKGNEPIVSYHVTPPGVENYFAAWQELIDGVEQLKPEYFSGGLYYVEAFMKYGCFGVMVTNDLPGDEKKILGRFAIEFERTYTRFLDLQKAEAQAREATIEAALEKVRSRSLAMHRSDEIKDVVLTVLDKIMELGIEMNGGVSLVTFFPDSKDFLHWLTIGPDFFNVRLPYFDHVIFKECADAREKGMELFANIYSGDVKRSYFKWLMEQTGFSAAPQDLKDWVNGQSYFGFSFAIQKNSGVFLNDYTGKSFSKETNEILMRFSKVFEQSYVRFLDLQKAEAQAREAQIEAALERVRSRTMGMQKSNELGEVAVLLYRQFLSLGVSSVLNCGYVEVDEINNSQLGWMTKTDGSPSGSFNLPMIGDPVFQDRYDSWKRKDSVFHQIVTGDQLKKHIEFIRHTLGSKEVEELVVTKFPDPTIFYCGNFSNGYLHIITGTLLSKAEENLLERFTRVFEQTYTRFLDLQKAEAQAREAQIEAALEKVRSRSLAMHQSSELEEVIMVVSEQLLQLQFRFHNVSFSSTNEQKETTFWLATPGRPHPFLIQLPYLETTMLTRVFEARKNGIDFFADTLTAGENQEWLQHLIYKSRNSFTEEDKKYLLTLKGLARSTVLTKHIILAIINYAIVPLTQEQNFILKRFGNVFEQAYTRFLDLQKAEAQARESQVEAALEKVRSRSLAMHKSDELLEVVKSVFDRFQELNIELMATTILIFEKKSKDIEWWLVNKIDQQLSRINIKYTDVLYLRNLTEAKENNKELFSACYSREEKNEFFSYVFEHSDFKNVPETVKKVMLESPVYNMSVAFGGNIGILIYRLSDNFRKRK